MEPTDVTTTTTTTTTAPPPRTSPDRTSALDAVRAYVAALGRVPARDEDLEIAALALSELLDGAELFGRFSDRPKVAVFGSARTTRDDPLFAMARDFSRAMADRGWMTISGAGPGIMEAAAEGSGREHTIGVNVELPFEQGSNAYIDPDTRLVAMKYFFTRKVSMTRPAQAFVIFPGGLGTMDEVFEVLTLMHTGKTSPAPILLVDVPGGTFWRRWREYLMQEVVGAGYVDEAGIDMAQLCDSANAAVTEIEHFYSNYQGFSRFGDRALVRLRRVPKPVLVSELTTHFPEFASPGGFVTGDSTLEFNFAARHYSRLHQLIHFLNGI